MRTVETVLRFLFPEHQLACRLANNSSSSKPVNAYPKEKKSHFPEYAVKLKEVKSKPDAVKLKEVKSKPDAVKLKEVKSKPDAVKLKEVKSKPDAVTSEATEKATSIVEEAKQPCLWMQKLDELIGLKPVKDLVHGIHKQLLVKKMREQAGFAVDRVQTLHMIFTGNPGTGKTTVARLVAEMLREMGYLPKGHLIEVGRAELIGQYQGHTAPLVKKVFESARGGVLFIDEAYSLCSSSLDTFGQEALATLLKEMEDHRDDLIVILAGYEQEMNEFLKINSGMSSRFSVRIPFPDYSADELFQLATLLLRDRFFLTPEAERVLKKEIYGLRKKNSNQPFSNGRMVRNLLERIIRTQSSRLADMLPANVTDPHWLVTIEAQDIMEPEEPSETSSFDMEQEFSLIVGLENVKNFFRSLQAQIEIHRERVQYGWESGGNGTLHLVFTGNPGTGKTTFARLAGKLLHQLGILASARIVEVDRSNLVAGYVGQTAIKTRDTP